MSTKDDDYLNFLRYQEVTPSNFANGRKPRKKEAWKVIKSAEKATKKEAKKRGRS